MHRPCASPRFSSIRCSIVDEAGLVELMSLSAGHAGSLHPAPGYLAFSKLISAPIAHESVFVVQWVLWWVLQFANFCELMQFLRNYWRSPVISEEVSIFAVLLPEAVLLFIHSACSSNPVNVVLLVLGEVWLMTTSSVGDVQASRRNVLGFHYLTTLLNRFIIFILSWNSLSP